MKLYKVSKLAYNFTLEAKHQYPRKKILKRAEYERIGKISKDKNVKDCRDEKQTKKGITGYEWIKTTTYCLVKAFIFKL